MIKYLKENWREVEKYLQVSHTEVLRRVLDGSLSYRRVSVAGSQKGFILYRDTDEQRFVYALFLEKGLPRAVLTAVVEGFLSQADRDGKKSVVFDTLRPGWARRLKSFGFNRLPQYRMEARI